jgi:hypothetical protein
MYINLKPMLSVPAVVLAEPRVVDHRRNFNLVLSVRCFVLCSRRPFPMLIHSFVIRLNKEFRTVSEIGPRILRVIRLAVLASLRALGILTFSWYFFCIYAGVNVISPV